ncbi:MAG: hypothetical protein ABIH83_05660 [Candidatus Micrarchaeota archaeon]
MKVAIICLLAISLIFLSGCCAPINELAQKVLGENQTQPAKPQNISNKTPLVPPQQNQTPPPSQNQTPSIPPTYPPVPPSQNQTLSIPPTPPPSPPKNQTPPSPGISPCINLEEYELVDCIAGLAIDEKDVTICTSFTEQDLRFQCIARWCLSPARDFNACDLLTDPDDRMGCFNKCNPNPNT